MNRLVLVVPADLSRPTGGNRYDASLAAALGRLGVLVEQRPASGSWPVATAAERERLKHLLVDRSAPVLADGLVACGAPDAVSAAVAAGSRVHVLVHLPLARDVALSEPAAAELDVLERQALHRAVGVVAVSHWAAADLRHRHALDVVAVAQPGTDPAALSTGSRPPRVLQLASVTRLKDQLTVVQALDQVRDLPWTADLTGALDVDPHYTGLVRAEVERRQLTDRVRLTGPLAGSGLCRAWDAADLLLLPSVVETWGMVVSEALARGVPAVVSRGTGAQEALGRAVDGSLPGAAVTGGDPVSLATGIRDLLGPGRDRAKTAAAERRRTLRRWEDTARDVLTALDGGATMR